MGGEILGEVKNVRPRSDPYHKHCAMPRQYNSTYNLYTCMWYSDLVELSENFNWTVNTSASTNQARIYYTPSTDWHMQSYRSLKWVGTSFKGQSVSTRLG